MPSPDCRWCQMDTVPGNVRHVRHKVDHHSGPTPETDLQQHEILAPCRSTEDGRLAQSGEGERDMPDCSWCQMDPVPGNIRHVRHRADHHSGPTPETDLQQDEIDIFRMIVDATKKRDAERDKQE